MKIKYFIIINILTLVFIGCKKTNKKSNFFLAETLKYKNDSDYCKGKYLSTINKNDTFYTQVGEWTYKYPNGIIWIIDNYDGDGNFIDQYNYYSNGHLSSYYKTEDNLEEFKYFNPNGSIKSIYIYKTSSNGNQDNENSKDFEIKNFYENGMILSESIGIEGVEKSLIVYDSIGQKMLSIMRENGRWKTGKYNIPKLSDNENPD